MNRFFLTTLALALLTCAGASWAGIGVFEVAISGDCPYPISYLLNKDATSVTIDIVPSLGGPSVKTWSFVSPDVHCGRGAHTDLAWDPANDVPLPAAGNYVLKVSATGAAVTGYSGDPALMPFVWEQADAADPGPWRVYGIAVNHNPSGPLYGRVYVGNFSITGGKAKGIYEYTADGAFVRNLPLPGDVGGSAPWGMAFDSDDHLWVTDRSKARIMRYTWNGSAWSYTFRTGTYDRYIDVTGSGASFKLAQTCAGNGSPLSNDTRLYYGTVEQDLSDPLKNYTRIVGDVGVSGDSFAQPAWHPDGNVLIASVGGASDASTPPRGSVTKWDTSNPSNMAWRNANLSRATGICIDTNGTDVWLGRMSEVTGAGYTDYSDPNDTDARHQSIYKFHLADIETINPYASPQPNWIMRYGVGTASGRLFKSVYHISPDPAGNLALTGGQTSYDGAGVLFGVYEEPLGVVTSHNTTSHNEVYWPGEYIPVIKSMTVAPDHVPADAATPTLITVVAEDRNNTVPVNDIASVRVHCPSVGWGTPGNPSSGWPMSLRSRAGIENTYYDNATIARGSGAGWHTVTVYASDVHSAVPVQHGTFQIYVTAGYISGRITEGNTGYAAANITVKTSFTDANSETFTTEAVTNSNGEYVIEATEAPNVSVFPARSPNWIYSSKTYPGSTYPAEFNVMSDWPSDPGTSDWPKTVSVTLGGTTSGVDGNVHPLAVTQVTYDWQAGTPKPGGRTVCLLGTVLRQAEDAARGRKGCNGYYWLQDTKFVGTVMSCKIVRGAGDPEVVEADKVVIMGTYDIPVSYTYGRITQLAGLAPVVKAHGQTMPNCYIITGAESTDPVGWSIGRYQGLNDKVVTEVGATYFKTEPAKTGWNATRWEIDTVASTGIEMPVVGDRVDAKGVLDELPGVGRVMKPGKDADVDIIRTFTDLGDIKKAKDGTRIFDNATSPLIVSYVDPGDVGGYDAGRWFWIEAPDRSSGLKVFAGATAQFLPTGGLVRGEKITHLKGQLNSTGTSPNDYMDRPRELQLTEVAVKSADPPDEAQPMLLDLTVKSFGGGWFSNLANPASGQGTPPVINSIGPPMTWATGLNTEGLLVKVAGTVTGYGDSGDGKIMWCWIDDGSGVDSDQGYKGIRCVRLYNMFEPWPRGPSDVGRPASVTGLCSNRFISGVGRIRMLHMRCIPGTGGGGVDQLDWLDD